jgi:RNA polymerase sigma-70 factor, ECF subfamily
MGSVAASVRVMEEASPVRLVDREAEGRRWIAALSAILSKLDSYRFESRFTTWAYKFAILEAAVRTRRRAWEQREVLSALVLADVPIDVLAERLGTTRGALYKTLHDARRKLRTSIGADHDASA